jgi:hypothetical protein
MTRRIASLLSILLLLLAAAPALACVTETAMSRAESDCCRVLHGHCGQMEKQGCCSTRLETERHPQLAAATAAAPPAFMVATWLEPTVLPPPASVRIAAAMDSQPPPGWLAASVTILRI